MARIPGVIPSKGFNKQLVAAVRYVERQPRGGIGSGTQQPLGHVGEYILHDELVGRSSAVSATALTHAPYTTAQIVLTSTGSWSVVVGGQQSPTMTETVTGLQVREALQPLLPSVNFIVHGYSGRWIVEAIEADSTNISTMSYGQSSTAEGYVQDFAHTRPGPTVNVKAFAANADEKITAGNFCVGYAVRGGVKVITECRTWDGAIVTPTIYDPTDEWKATGSWSQSGAPNWLLSAANTVTTAPDGAAVLEFEFSNGAVCEVTNASWSWAAEVLSVSNGASNWDWTVQTFSKGVVGAGVDPVNWRVQI